MSAFLQQLFAGLATGGIYACVALALVMIYQATHHINFAQGEMAMFSTFLAWKMIEMGMPYWQAFLLTVVISFAIGSALEYAVIRPMSKAPVLSVVVVFIGLLVIFYSMAGWLFGFDMRQFMSPFTDMSVLTNPFMTRHEFGTILITLIMVALLFVFFRYTKLGLAMRGVAENASSSRLVGINVGAMLMLGWGLAAAIGAVGGMMAAPIVFLDPSMMGGILIYAFAAALIGGIDNPAGAVLGGFIVGVTENILGTYVVGTELKLAVALVLIIGVLIVRPSGLLGRRIVVRV